MQSQLISKRWRLVIRCKSWPEPLAVWRGQWCFRSCKVGTYRRLRLSPLGFHTLKTDTRTETWELYLSALYTILSSEAYLVAPWSSRRGVNNPLDFRDDRTSNMKHPPLLVPVRSRWGFRGWQEMLLACSLSKSLNVETAEVPTLWSTCTTDPWLPRETRRVCAVSWQWNEVHPPSFMNDSSWNTKELSCFSASRHRTVPS